MKISKEQQQQNSAVVKFTSFAKDSLATGRQTDIRKAMAAPVDPSDGERAPLLLHQSHSDVPTCGDEGDGRRASFLAFALARSQIKQSKETDKLIQYYDKSGRLAIVRELRPEALIGNITRLFDWQLGFKEDAELEKMNKTTRAFYREQNLLIEKYIEVDKLLDSGIQHSMIRNYGERNNGEHVDSGYPQLHRRASAVPGNVDLETGNLLGYNKDSEVALVNFAIVVNFFANVILLLGKTVVALLTSSISIVASLLDSALDFLSTVIIFGSNKLSQSKHSKDFPVGKNRLEPIGVLVFSIIIIISFLQVGLESIQRLMHSSPDEIVEVGQISIYIMLLTIAAKLGCFFWCKSIKSSSVKALTQDALVDVVFNTFSLIMPVLGYYLQIYWLDPLGALSLSIYVVTLWSITSVEHVSNLTGRNADPEDFKVVLYLCMRFAEKIKTVKDISCYHVGDSINVEVDLILDGELSLRDSHDIAEALQYTIEALPIVNVERAFVHIDYTVGNFKGHLAS